MFQKLAAIAVLGALGSVTRYFVAGAVQHGTTGAFPWGTLVVNCAGCLLFGFVWSLADERMIITGGMRTVILIGFLGALTTYSTFAFETAQLARDSEWLYAVGNMALQNGVGVAAVIAGVVIGKML